MTSRNSKITPTKFHYTQSPSPVARTKDVSTFLSKNHISNTHLTRFTHFPFQTYSFLVFLSTGGKWHTPKTFSGRFFALFWLFARLVILASYTANLARFVCFFETNCLSTKSRGWQAYILRTEPWILMIVFVFCLCFGFCFVCLAVFLFSLWFL